MHEKKKKPQLKKAKTNFWIKPASFQKFYCLSSIKN